jgi:peptidoglycan-associated lipoprotein
MRLPPPLSRALAPLLVLAAALVLTGCPSKKMKYPLCGGDKDCKEGEHCVNKHCQQCGDDSHCEEFEHCEAGACVLDPGACREDGDCTGGQVCKQNKCSACESDAECGADKSCSNGKCLDRGTCSVDEDCADDEDCVDGVCKHAGRDKAPDVSCKLEPVFFDFDQTGLSEQTKSSLSGDAECMQEVQGRGVLIIGHTDPRGTEEYNIALSEHRAQTVGDYLARLGIDPARFRYVPKGETEAQGSDEQSWGQDRRVEFEWQ